MRNAARRTAAQPEVLIVGPADSKDLTFQKLVDMLVEYGVHIASDSYDRLPKSLPGNLTGYKAVIVDMDLPGVKDLPAGRGQKIIRYNKPKEFSWCNERPQWIWLNELLMRHDVKPQNEDFLERNAARPDKDVILGQAAAMIAREPEWLRRWCDSSLVRLEGLWTAAKLYARKDIRREVLRCIDDTLAAYKDAPVYGKGSLPNGLFKHPIYPGLLLPIWKETGIARYRDAALGSMETLREARRIAREWNTRAPYLQTESLDRKPWQWAMRAHWCHEPGFYAPAVACMQAGYRACFDHRKMLWAHYGIEGRQKGLAWGRGQGWALYGLVGLLEHLPQAHPDFERMRAWIDQTAEGLRRAQDPATGMWHNVMGEPTTRLETSGTAKCIRHLSRAWRRGLCRQPFIPGMLARAWRGLKAHTFQHRSCSRIYGTGPGYDVTFYATIGTGGNYTAAVQAGSEYVTTFGPLV